MNKDGTYLTKAQKEAKARAEAMLAALKEQGVEVPSKDSIGEESRPKKVVYGKRERKKKKNQEGLSQTLYLTLLSVLAL